MLCVLCLYLTAVVLKFLVLGPLETLKNYRGCQCLLIYVVLEIQTEMFKTQAHTSTFFTSH